MKQEITKRVTPEEKELRKKLVQLAELEGRLGENELELTTIKAELNAFATLYKRTVGVKYVELKEIEARIAEARSRLNPQDKGSQEEAKQARDRAEGSRESTENAEQVKVRSRASDNLKRLYREVAKRIHPDLAEDDFECSKRQELMVKANRAYEAGDEETLGAILNEWEDSPESVKGKGTVAVLIRIIRKMAQVEDRLKVIESEIRRLKKSELYQLKRKVEAAEKEGNELLAEMTAAVEAQISSARERFNRIMNQSKEPTPEDLVFFRLL
jgi:CII-binding regulator of phage lambda lysogenization HflD